MAIKAADTLKPNSDFAIAEAEDITIKTDDGGEERLPAYLARLKTAVADTTAANAYTDQKIADLVGGAPETLDTLKEIADELAKNETAMESITAAVQNHTHDNATATAAGFMSALDKTKLDSTGQKTVATYVDEAAALAVKNHTHDLATTEAAGFMSAADKASLDSTGGSSVADYVAAKKSEILNYVNNKYGSYQGFLNNFEDAYNN